MNYDLPRDISILHRKMCIVLNARFEAIGISTSQAMVLICLNSYGSLTQAELCRKLDVDKGAITKTIARLEHDGFVSKCTSPSDVRAYLVSLTDKAAALLPQIQRIQSEWVDRLTEGMSPIERSVFIQLFQKAAERASSMCE